MTIFTKHLTAVSPFFVRWKARVQKEKKNKLASLPIDKLISDEECKATASLPTFLDREREGGD